MAFSFRNYLSHVFPGLFPRPVMVYLAPHQDDELLSMGVDLCRQTAAHTAHVHVVLFTDGSKSNMRRRICDGKDCPFHEGLHQYELEIPEFVWARDREFTASCLALGVKAEHIHILPDRAIDGSLQPEAAGHIIEDLLQAFPKNTTVCTISPFGGESQHPDHRALGQAALKLYRSGKITGLRLFVEPYCVPSSREAYPHLELTELTANDSTLPVLKNAVSAYSLWAPEQGRYAVGYHSVFRTFDEFLNKPTAYVHTAENLPE